MIYSKKNKNSTTYNLLDFLKLSSKYFEGQLLTRIRNVLHSTKQKNVFTCFTLNVLHDTSLKLYLESRKKTQFYPTIEKYPKSYVVQCVAPNLTFRRATFESTVRKRSRRKRGRISRRTNSQSWQLNVKGNFKLDLRSSSKMMVILGKSIFVMKLTCRRPRIS